LMIGLRQARLEGQPLPELILDVTRVPELNRLELTGERPFLGAAVTFRRLETDPEVARLYPLLAKAASMVGSVQVRQTGTIGGNAANSSPAADGVSAITALGAVAILESPRGRREMPLSELITAPNQNLLAEDELIVGFWLDRLPNGTGQAFSKVGRRQAVAIARLNVAAAVSRDLSEVRLSVGACFPSPRRLTMVEELVKAGEPGPDLWQKAGRAAAANFTDVCGWRASAAYKVEAIARVTARTLATAWAQAGGAA
ncbi:MAG: FAD binding domain-containing protein, partial [Desulfarculus sp.]|nr:FAD binding domain-containing protein [Desulfarculus sp.]